MNTEREKQVEALFQSTLDQPEDRRAAFLSRACAGDAGLQAEVRSLLEHYTNGEARLLATPASVEQLMRPADALDAVWPGPRILQHRPDDQTLRGPPAFVGRYRIIRKVHEGGIACVYEAEQEPLHRRVALKVVWPGLVSRRMLRRFGYEAEVLARLQHPGIAQVLEAGTAETPQGRQPFFALEFIDGLPLVEHARKHDLSTRERLRLVIDVCAAVQHAHQHGVIHRDLKPDNILVDATGQPKVLDFGIARATDADIQRVTTQTDVGQIIGTIPYMSPEQIAGDFTRLDTRTDVYSLGVIIYELLTGRLPHDVAHRTVTEAARVIREVEPPRLSSLDRVLKGDLETIVRKALAKDPAHRYQSAAALGEDLGRFLANRPITARRPSTMYELRKMIARHKAPFGLIIALLVVLAGASIGLSVLHRRAVAQAEAARRASDLVQSILASLDIGKAGRVIPTQRVLDEAAQRVRSELADQPLIAAQMHTTIGTAYHKLGQYEPAVRELRTALELRRALLGENAPEVVENMRQLGDALLSIDDIAAGEPLLRRALASNHEFRLGDAALARAANSLGEWLIETNRLAEAEPLMREALDLRLRVHGRRHPEVAESLNNLGSVLRRQGRCVEAEPLVREALDLLREFYGAEHLDVAAADKVLAKVLSCQGRYDEAETFLRESLSIRRKLLGDDHGNTFAAMTQLAEVLEDKGELQDARTLLEEVAQYGLKSEAPTHPGVIDTLHRLATVMMKQGDFAATAALLEQIYKDQPQAAPDSADTAVTESILARCLAGMGHCEEAEARGLHSVSVLERTERVPTWQYRDAVKRLCELYEACALPQKAAEWRTKLAGIKADEMSASHGSTDD